MGESFGEKKVIARSGKRPSGSSCPCGYEVGCCEKVIIHSQSKVRVK